MHISFQNEPKSNLGLSISLKNFLWDPLADLVKESQSLDGDFEYRLVFFHLIQSKPFSKLDLGIPREHKDP